MEASKGSLGLLDKLHRSYMKRESGTMSFNCNGEFVSFTLNRGDVSTVRGEHFDRGGTFNDLLYGDVTNILFHSGFDNTPGHEIDRSMEMILFELAVGMDKKMEQKLADVRKSGKLPQEIVRTAVVPQESGTDEQIFVLSEGSNIIGRSHECDVVVVEQSLSRKHAEIRIANGQASIIDLDSSNGVKINRKLVREMDLLEGNLIYLGNTVFRFLWAEGARGVLFKMSSQEDEDVEDQQTMIIPH